MTTITPSDALPLVRKNLDEIEFNPSVMYAADTTDNSSLDTVIQKTLPEAINIVNLAAPLSHLEGEDLSGAVSISGSVAAITLNDEPIRILAVKAEDSDVVISEERILLAGSIEALKQGSQYARGTYDDPEIVMASLDSLIYYGIRNATGTTVTTVFDIFKGIKRKYYSSNSDSYSVSSRLYWPIVDHLTGMVLQIYGETEKAGQFLMRGI